MKHKIRTLAVAALVAASALALPTAAQADTIYPPSNACSVTPSVVTPGATVTFACSDGTFSPSESVSVTVEGNTSASVGFVKFAVSSSGSTTSSASGSISVPITFPSDASGNYNITAASETSAGGASTVSISTTGSGSGSGEGTLPATGSDSAALLGLWVGGGALVLAGGAVALTAAVRRNRREHAGA